ncbi:Tat binding protein 1(TBP-1)-interacting protein (TBPIP) family protein [Cryptosporidium meleagridis]|uniref:Tat binding protein 1(TBP-1)-interacting protein (TBPIP) family protein n=1 Tax=Cryptosporidium meleagridis TaxID=93969 RepID=A0A2P4Z6G0_9CRYT|nr:Tat binding protein 1(TBP-1)-interacting protein (TBPIP) family protein [Cryptosporidium meleagridis]
MVKRSKEEGNNMEEEGAGLDETQQSKVEDDNIESKSQVRPSRNSRKVVKYTDFDDEDDELDDFESDFDEEMDFIDEGDEDSGDEDDEDDLDLEEEEIEKCKKGKKSTAKKRGGESISSKAAKPKKPSKESSIEDEFEFDDEDKDTKPTKKKKLSAPKNLTKRNVANSGGGSVAGDAGEAIFNYMKEQNRPYSVQNVVDNLHNAYSKKQVTDEMERLAVEGKFICKEYGKQKVYLIDQSDCKELNKDEMEALDKSISAFESELNDLEVRLKQLKQETRNISIPLTIDELEEKIMQENLKNKSLKEEISRREKMLDDDCEIIPANELKELKNSLLKKQAKLKKLKSACKSAVDTFSESMERKTSDLMEEIGIEMV